MCGVGCFDRRAVKVFVLSTRFIFIPCCLPRSGDHDPLQRTSPCYYDSLIQFTASDLSVILKSPSIRKTGIRLRSDQADPCREGEGFSAEEKVSQAIPKVITGWGVYSGHRSGIC